MLMSPRAESLDQAPGSLNKVRQLGTQVDEVFIDDHGQPEQRHRHEQGQQRPGELRVDPLAYCLVSRQDRVRQEHGKDQGTE